MDLLPHEYLTCSNYRKEQIRITFFIKDHKQYVKLSLEDEDLLRTCTEQVMSRETVIDSIRCAEYKLFHGN